MLEHLSRREGPARRKPSGRERVSTLASLSPHPPTSRRAAGPALSLRERCSALLLAFAVLACTPARAEPLLADWAVLVVAADQKTANGKLTEGFDNARRDLSAAFLAKGARLEHLRQLSVDPARDKTGRPPLRATPDALDLALGEIAPKAKGGCLLYFTSHGTPRGIAMGEGLYLPVQMDQLADKHCKSRPTVVVVSACYSGVFLPFLAEPERLILSAARRDRTSFGCGESDRMPYFDACVLQALPAAPGFAELARATRRCVETMEQAGKLKPPSEPQAIMGAEMRVLLPLLRFEG